MSKRISQLSELTTVAVDDYLVVLDSSAGDTKKISVKNLTGYPDFGWVATGEVWTYNAWNSTTKEGIITVPTDATVKYFPGMFVRFSQTTGGVKYGIITKVTSTALYVFFGTDYTFTNETVTSPVFSAIKNPAGFNRSPNKWKLELRDTTGATQASPVSGTWYNLGSLSFTVPSGSWNLSIDGQYYFDLAGSGDREAGFALSTSNNSVSDIDLAHYQRVANVNSNLYNKGIIARRKTVDLTANTTYYAIASPRSGNLTTILFEGGSSATILRAVCALL